MHTLFEISNFRAAWSDKLYSITEKSALNSSQTTIGSGCQFVFVKVCLYWYWRIKDIEPGASRFQTCMHMNADPAGALTV